MNEETIKAMIKSFLLKLRPGINFGDEIDIFDKGYLNSMMAIEMVMYIEKSFQIKMGDEDLKIENFRTINAMNQLIQKKLLNKV